VRAVLIVNPNATSTTPAGRDLLAHALESRVKLTVAHTDHRGHAIEIARDAAREGDDMVIVHGGDGTVNEVVNGILGEAGPGSQAPAVGVVPGGSANVFARALGISPDPIEATNQLVDLLSVYRTHKSWRRIGLMDCGERWCVFTAGMGVDGDVVAAVEAQRDKGRKVTASRYIRVAIREMLASARKELYPRRDPRDAGQRPQGADPDAAPTEPGARPGCSLRIRVELESVDVCQHTPRLDEPHHHLRDRPRRVRDHQHERLGQFGAGATDGVKETAHRSQAPDPRRRSAVGAGDERHAGGVSDRR